MRHALRHPRLAIALLAALTAGVPGTADAQAAATPDTARVRIVSIPGSIPAARNAVVVLPAGYHESLRRYPVLYLLHGHDGGHHNWLDRTNLLAHTARLPLIVVLPDAGNSWYTNSVAHPEEKFEEYVAREIPAFVDQSFRTLTYREARYVAGLSMGGYGALKLGLKYPGRFSLAGSFSAAPLAAAGTGSQTLMDALGPAGSATRTENDLLALAGAASVASTTRGPAPTPGSSGTAACRFSSGWSKSASPGFPVLKPVARGEVSVRNQDWHASFALRRSHGPDREGFASKIPTLVAEEAHP